VTGIACGVGVEGSGWVARPGLVVTAAHVVAGQTGPLVQAAGSTAQLRATPVAFDARNDVAVLRVPGLDAPALTAADPADGVPVAILGFPNDGPFSAVPGRLGRTAVVLTADAYGHGPVARTITSVSGVIRHGDSGGPIVDARGQVRGTVFASRNGSTGGFAVPADPVRTALADANNPVSTGDCAG
jgi:S1-C subfamily serine protease